MGSSSFLPSSAPAFSETIPAVREHSLRLRLARAVNLGGRAPEIVSAQLLVNEDLLEWEGRNGMRSLSLLLMYFGAGDVPACVVGSFDDGIGTPLSAGAEVLAAAVAGRLGRDDFRLMPGTRATASIPSRRSRSPA